MVGERGEAVGPRPELNPVGDRTDTDGILPGSLSDGPSVRHGCHHSPAEVHRIGAGHAFSIAYSVSVKQREQLMLWVRKYRNQS